MKKIKPSINQKRELSEGQLKSFLNFMQSKKHIPDKFELLAQTCCYAPDTLRDLEKWIIGRYSQNPNLTVEFIVDLTLKHPGVTIEHIKCLLMANEKR